MYSPEKAAAFYYILPAILLAHFLFEQWMAWLNHRSSRQPLPQLLDGFCDENEYLKQQNYQHANYRFGIISSVVSFLVMMAMLLLYGFAFVDGLALSLTGRPLLQSLLFLGILLAAQGLIQLPFQVYDTFVIEERYGFNKTTPKLFFTDLLKSLLLTIILGGAILALILMIYQAAGKWFWLLAWGVMALFSLFFSLFYSHLIVPLFNKQTPLPEGELRTAIETFARNAGFSISRIFLIDGSKRSTKANAYFTGWGDRKRIVLYDTLTDEMTIPEIVAVLAHETGHYRKKHLLKGMVTGLIQSGVILFLFSLVVESQALSLGLGVAEPKFHTGVIAFAILFSPLTLITGVITNLLSRKYEFEADSFAASQGEAAPLITALKKLAVKNLSNLTPHPLFVFFNYSHPPILKRVENLQKQS